MLDDSMFGEFKIEAGEMLDESEELLLELDKGEEFEGRYNGIFRAFHSLKGAAGMFGLDELQTLMHGLETLFEKLKTIGKISKDQCDYFLKGVDEAKSFLAGQSISFDHLSEQDFFSLGDSDGTAPISPETKGEVVDTTIESDGEYEYEYEYVEVEESEEDVAFGDYIREAAASDKQIALNAHVVIIDDEPDIVEILSMMMEDAGFRVSSYTSSKKLLTEIEELNADLVLSDINMPEIDGVTLMDEVCNLVPDLPFIFISGFISKELILDGLKKGVFSYIEKPFKEDQVVSIATQAVIKYRTIKLLNKSINYILYQYNDLDEFLRDAGKDSIRTAMRTELKNILEQKKALLSFKQN
jgi:FixJ family two-component response regulator/HPt (histidine-containing phosphotransfer) domain-containing protein